MTMRTRKEELEVLDATTSYSYTDIFPYSTFIYISRPLIPIQYNTRIHTYNTTPRPTQRLLDILLLNPYNLVQYRLGVDLYVFE